MLGIGNGGYGDALGGGALGQRIEGGLGDDGAKARLAIDLEHAGASRHGAGGHGIADAIGDALDQARQAQQAVEARPAFRNRGAGRAGACMGLRDAGAGEDAVGDGLDFGDGEMGHGSSRSILVPMLRPG